MRLLPVVVAICAGGCVGGVVDGKDYDDATASVTTGASYTVTRKGSGKCLDVAGGGSANGTGVQQAACSGAANQVFRVEAVGGGVRLVNPSTNKCVDVNGAGTSNGTRIQLWSCNGTSAQTFALDNVSGWVRLRNPGSGKCLDVSGASKADGVNLQLWTCNASEAQLWQLAAGAPPADGLTYRKANLTNFTSYPEPGSDECDNYNGCMWAGQFAFVEGKQTEDWVRMHDIVAVHAKDAGTYALKTLRLRQGTHQLDVTVYDECADSDCSGCCTANSKQTGFLIDIEKYTMQRFGSGDGIVEFACLDCQ